MFTGWLCQVQVLERFLETRSLEGPEGGPGKLRPMLGTIISHCPCNLNFCFFLGEQDVSPWSLSLFPSMTKCPFPWLISPLAALESCGPFVSSCSSWVGAGDVMPSPPFPVGMCLVGGAAPAGVPRLGY